MGYHGLGERRRQYLLQPLTEVIDCNIVEEITLYALVIMSRHSRRKHLAELFAKSNKCCHCGCETYLTGQPIPKGMRENQRATVDHKICRSHGGTDHASNLALCCRRCNALRGNVFSFDEFTTTRNKCVKQSRREKAKRDKERVVKSDQRLQHAAFSVAVFLHVLEKYFRVNVSEFYDIPLDNIAQ